MGISKSDFFTEEQNELAALLKALGHPARVAILEFLLKQTACVCGDIVDELPLSQATVSQHLKELKAVNLIQGSISGNSICYCINQETLQHLQEKLGAFISVRTESGGINQCC